MNSEPAISVRNLSKCYKLGTIGRHTLVDEAQYLWHKIRGKDPRQHFSKIGHTATEARKVEAEKEGDQEFWALKDVSFDVQPGEVIGVIGRNGAGKSTLLKILTRITEPTSGEAIINGRVASLLEVGTGFHPELTGRENVYMNGTILGMKKREIDAKLDEIVTFSELEKFIDTPVKRYSSGMYVRLAFAVAAHLEPEILLVDEVLAVGDAEFQKKCIGKMREVAGIGRTVLFVSHNMGAVRSLCDRALMIRDGQIAREGAVVEVIQSYLKCNEASLSGGRIDLSGFQPRSGHGQVRAVEFWASVAGDITGQPETGKPAIFRIKCEADSPIRRMGVALAVMDSLGAAVFICSTRMSNSDTFQFSSGNFIVCQIDSLDLIPATYGVTIKIMDDFGTADYIECAEAFQVARSSEDRILDYGSAKWGSVRPRHKWSLESMR